MSANRPQTQEVAFIQKPKTIASVTTAPTTIAVPTDTIVITLDTPNRWFSISKVRVRLIECDVSAGGLVSLVNVARRACRCKVGAIQ